MAVNPCHEIKKRTVERRRERVLSADEIKTAWTGLEGEKVKMTPLTRIALRLILATAQRPGEVVGAAWDELGEGWDKKPQPIWTIPASRSKNGRAHRVPLSPLAADLLKEARESQISSPPPDTEIDPDDNTSRFVFPSPRGDAPMTEAALPHAVRKNAALGVAHFTPHDLRRTAATHMTGEHCGVSRFILERILNHSDPSVTATYDHYEYDREKRDALEVWGRRLKEIISGETVVANVIDLRGSAS